MKRWLALVLIVACGVAAIVASELQRIGVQPSPTALLNWLAGLQREAARLPASATRLTDADEVRIGNEMADRVGMRFPTAANNPAIQTYVERVGACVAAHTHRKLPYKFHYLPNIGFINAFALPGGHIFIGAGMINLMDSEDELAAVLGHEIEHVDRYHCAERVQVESRLRKIPLGGVVQLPIELFEAGYSKDQELEADREGTRLAVWAGYSPLGALRMFETFDRLHRQQITPARAPQQEVSRIALETLEGYFRSHPAPSERIAQMREMIVDEHWEKLTRERDLEVASLFHPQPGLAPPSAQPTKPPSSANRAVARGESQRLPSFTEALSFSPNGRSLATVSFATVVVWDLETGRIRQRLAGNAWGVTSLAFHPNSRWLAAGSQDSTVKVWDTTAGSELHTLRGHTTKVYAVAFTRDGSVASVSVDGVLKLWECATGHELRTIPLGGPIQSAAFSPDRSLLATRSLEPADTTIKLWDVAEGRELRAFPAGAGRAMAFSPDHSLLAQADRSELAIRIFEVATGHELPSVSLGLSLARQPNLVNSLAFSPNGRWLASVQAAEERAANVIHVWEVATGREALRLPAAGSVAQSEGSGAATFVPGVAFSPDGQWLASTAGAFFGVATQRELPGGRYELTLRTGNAGPVSKLAFLGDGHELASAAGLGFGGDVRLWDISTGQTIQTLVDVWDGSSELAFSPDGQMLATEEPFASHGGERAVRLWDLKAAEGLRTFTISTQGRGGSGISSLAFSPDGHLLAAGCFNKIVLADTGTGRELHTLVTGGDATKDVEAAQHDYDWKGLILGPYFVSSLAFSPDGRRLVSLGNKSHSLQLWDTATGQRLASTITEAQATELKRWETIIFSAVLSPDGRWLAVLRAGATNNEGVRPAKPIGKGPVSGSDTSRLVLYDAATLHEVRSLSDLSEMPRSLSFSADAHQLAAIGVLSGQDTTLKVWDTSTGQLLRTLPLYHQRDIGATALSNDWQWLATVPSGEMGERTSIDVWEVSTGRHVRTLAGLPVRWLRGNAPPLKAQGLVPDYPPSQSQISLAGEFAKQADALAQKGNRAAAILRYQEALQLLPNDAQLHFGLGVQFEARGATTANSAYRFDPGKLPARPPSPALPKVPRADYESALEQYRLAHQLAPNNLSYRKAYERVSRLLRRP